MPAAPLEDIDLSDEEDAPLAQDIEDRKGSLKKDWDLFRILPPDEDTDLVEDQTFYNALIKTLKIFAYIVTFAVVLCGAVIAKSTTLLMTSQLMPNRTISHCYKYLEDRQFIAYSSVEERISWTWALYFCFMLAEIQTLLRGLRKWVFKGPEMPTVLEFSIPFICETLHTIGVALLVFLVLPTMDAVKGAMLTNAVCLVPGILGMLSRGFDEQWVVKCVIDVFAIICQMTALFVWPLFTPQKSGDHPWLIPIAAILVSFGWWENYVESSSPFEMIRKLGDMKRRLRASRYITYTIVPIWKMGLFLLCMLCCVWIKEGEGGFTLAFDKFDIAFGPHNMTIEEKRPVVLTGTNPDTNTNYLKPGAFLEESVFYAVQHAMFAQMIAAYCCYIFAKYACKICIQAFSFSFPILLAVPATMVTIVSLCGMRDNEVCFWDDVMPGYLFWTCPKGEFWEDFFAIEHAWAWILWIISYAWITIHIWQPKGIRLARSEKMFATPLYNSLLVDQTMAMNRRRDEDNVEVDGMETSETGPTYSHVPDAPEDGSETKVFKEDSIPRIYACATMWHETEGEMIEMMKSIFRMDADQCARRVALKYFEYVDPGYYEFETHILFDDAFQLSDTKDSESPMIINDYVRLFVKNLEKAASHVHGFIKLATPKKIPTPYGGRMEWTLPGKTKLYFHIKDKEKIRHKKRWSQVMYMYYLLGHRLMERPIPAARKEIIAENSFILAMDGDIDFQPNAVELLVDLMKKNKHLGAACGRIHPTGTGPMVWYQKFEYAVGHWLQKATEHVFGCVLCSPGCFSLFRGRALMDDNVMATYTTVSDKPIHYVQYDQGEDRWLCTLLLQRGYRVEYSAASDAKTQAPEGFSEFYNQRRRWVPSTMANIMDLLLNSEKVLKLNPDITYLYIVYQIVMMVGTILGPGTIFLMLVGAFATAFNLDQWTSFMYNFIPILMFILVCFFCKANIQLMVAQILSVIYALAMVAVIVAIALQVTEDGLMAPSSIFLVAVAASFIIAGIIHPKEFGCLPHGFMYYITIPSMYLLLMIYSLFNLNVVSWGTREGVKIKTKQELDAEKKELEEAMKNKDDKKKKGMFFGLLPNEKDEEGSFELSFAGLFKLMCCVKEKPKDEKIQLERIADALDRVSRRLDIMEMSMDMPTTPATVVTTRRNSVLNPTIPEEDEEVDPHKNDPIIPAELRVQRDDLMNPFWMEDRDLKKADVDFLPGTEIQFWTELIKTYLKPIDKDKKKEEKTAKELKELRNSVSFAFLMMNAVFVILVFLLQLEKEAIHIDWPFGGETNVTYKPSSSEVEVSIEYLELEPIGLVFVGFFGLILLTQFIGMCLHRFETFSHILAATTLAWCMKDTTTITKEAALQKDGVGLIRRLQQVKESPEGDEYLDADSSQNKNPSGRRNTITNLERHRYKKREVNNLEANFRRNFTSFAITADRRNSKLFKNDKTQAAFTALQERRSTVLHRRSSVIDRRKSQIFDDGFSSEKSRANSIAQSSNSSRGFDNNNSNRLFKKNLGKGRNPGPSKGRTSGEEFEMNDKYA